MSIDSILEVTRLRCEENNNPLGIDSPNPRLSWRIASNRPNTIQASYRISVATGPDLLANGAPDIWDSGVIASDRSTDIPYAGPQLASRTRYCWKVAVTDQRGDSAESGAQAFWEMGLFDESDWHARWIGQPDVRRAGWNMPLHPAPLLRRSFTLPKSAARARIYICGLGYNELTINGRRVGERVLDPIVTQYERHVGYATYDVGDFLQEGENVIGVLLGDGWYNPRTAEVWHFDKASWMDHPKLLLRLDIEMTDGQESTIVSDREWRFAASALRFSQLRSGEAYDAREEKPGWNRPGYDSSDWPAAAIVRAPGGVLFSQQAPSCAVVEILPAISRTTLDEDRMIVDFGQNIAGWAHLSAEAPSGTTITLRYSEKLTDSGELDTTAIAPYILEKDFQTDRYTFKGGGVEEWQPRFTYHGFRYIEVSGLSSAPIANLDIKACVVQSSFERIGIFESSDTILNRLYDCTIWSYRGNFVGIPTDCPHREKNGWTGDAQLASETGLLTFDASNAYAHWMRTIRDTQRPSGEIPGIVPSCGWGYNWGNGPAWDAALILIPYNIYLYRGDRRLIEDNYTVMKRYADFLASMSEDGLVRWGLADWCPLVQDATSPHPLVITAYAYANMSALSKIAAILGHTDDSARFESDAATYRAAWRREFWKGGGHVASDEQASLACALYFDFADPAERPAVFNCLVESIAREGGKPTFGICGAKWTPRVLAENGRVDLAYRLITQPDFPGWAYWLSQGATTLWEDWDGHSSRNHIMYGDIAAFMVTYLAGIQYDPNAPGFKRIRIRPGVIDDLDWARASYNSAYGEISSAWSHITPGNVRLDVTIPPNTTAEIACPEGYTAADGRALIEVGSGTHSYIIERG